MSDEEPAPALTAGAKRGLIGKMAFELEMKLTTFCLKRSGVYGGKGVDPNQFCKLSLS
jgi:hypothetical protein